MKKTLIITLALVFVLGITGAAFAAPANPFVDVPANHWAYSAVSKLAKDGVIDGMGDGTYQGQRTMTRYEMAQIVAKAMVKVDKADAGNRALIQKLEAEFASELNNLGVRVASLENRVGTIKISGDARIRYRNGAEKNGARQAPGNEWAQRFRLHLNAKVNEKTDFYGRLVVMNHELWGRDSDRVRAVTAQFTHRDIFSTGVDLVAGRMQEKIGYDGYFIGPTPGEVDGAKVMFGNKLKATIGYARFGASVAATATNGYFDKTQAAYVVLSGQITDEVGMYATYLQQKHSEPVQMKVWGVGADAKLGKDFKLFGEYYRNGGDNAEVNGSDPEYYAVRLAYKGAKRAVPQSWGAFVEYRRADKNLISNYSDAAIPLDNVKGFAVSGSVTLAQNITMDGYYTFNDKNTETGAKKGNFTRLQVNYFF